MIPTRFNPLGVLRGSPYFELTVEPTAESLTYGFTPYYRTGKYCRVVDWGDGSGESATGSGRVLSHTYAAAGTYTVKIKAACYWVIFGYNQPGRLLLKNCNGNWGALGNLTTGRMMFYGCRNAAFDFTTLPPGITDGYYMFCDCNSAILPLTSLPAGIGIADYMFGYCFVAQLPLTSLPAGLTSADHMLHACESAVMDITTLASNAPSGGWGVLTTIKNMFAFCAGVTGSQSAFLAACPAVTDTASAFSGTNTTE